VTRYSAPTGPPATATPAANGRPSFPGRSSTACAITTRRSWTSSASKTPSSTSGWGTGCPASPASTARHRPHATKPAEPAPGTMDRPDHRSAIATVPPTHLMPRGSAAGSITGSTAPDDPDPRKILTPTYRMGSPDHPWSTLLPICSRIRPTVSTRNQNAGQAHGLTCINVVGDTGIEPVTSTVSMSSRSIADLRLFEKRQVGGYP
jgi:hypothetical protein